MNFLVALFSIYTLIPLTVEAGERKNPAPKEYRISWSSVYVGPRGGGHGVRLDFDTLYFWNGKLLGKNTVGINEIYKKMQFIDSKQVIVDLWPVPNKHRDIIGELPKFLSTELLKFLNYARENGVSVMFDSKKREGSVKAPERGQ